MRIAAVFCAFCALACDDSDGRPATLIDEPRVLAVRADPPVVALDGIATIEVLAVDEAGARLDVTPAIRACYPWRPLTAPDRECGPDASVAITGGQIDAAAILEAFPPPPGSIEALVAAASSERCDAGFAAVEIPLVIDARDQGAADLVTKALRVAVDRDGVFRTNPAFGGLLFDGDFVAPGETATFDPTTDAVVSVELDRDAVDETCGDDDPTSLALESFQVNLYSTDGRFDDRSISVELGQDGAEAIGDTRFNSAAGPLALWLIATDADGGAAWAQFELVPSANQ